MSHGAGLVRTTCSSGGGPGAGAGQPGARPSEGLLDPVYPRTYSALLKVAQMVTLLIAFICVRSSVWISYSAYSYFEVVTICNLIMILAFYLVHLFRLYRLLTCISWPLSELLHYLIGTLLLLIASIVAASKSYSQSGLVAGAIFGFVATFLCLASIWMSYKISCVTQSAGEFRLSEHRRSLKVPSAGEQEDGLLWRSATGKGLTAGEALRGRGPGGKAEPKALCSRPVSIARGILTCLPLMLKPFL
ncbi:CKLF-like MARVEL transmembrane domain-containing protein 7 isoform X1 [Phoca vitulina]|uniref:CKLF-like MARVEL transmembrane domain-containing protein 7 isoform X1 n=2 Tax=Phocinae TaxID=3410118 RepID=UPI00139632AA|nr:CKLF-like MARVEL transmembrane domain-containing protein 7 isoform X1 [Phoca vitulina]